MNILAEPILKLFRKSATPNVEVGDVVRVHQKIREGNKERIQVFEGIVIATHESTSLDATFTVRKMASGVGVERTYLVHSPNITKIEFKRSSKVRRAKLYYLRDLTGKALKMKNRAVTKEKWDELLLADKTDQTEPTEADIAEAVKADEDKQAQESQAGEAQADAEVAQETTQPEVVAEVSEDSGSNISEEVNDSNKSEDSEAAASEDQPADAGDGADSASSGK